MGAHTTAADAMWMGTPVLTLEGRGFAARVCAGLVKSAGIPELVCTGLEEYVARAIAIAQTPGIAGELRKRLVNNRDTAALFDTPRLVKGLEGLYDRMWEEFRTGELPVPNLTNLASYAEIGLGLIEGREGRSIDPQVYAAEIARWNELEPVAPDHRLWPPSGTGNVLPLKRAAA